jgi:hypothetical protein
MTEAAFRRAALLLASSLTALLVLEGGVRVITPQDLNGWWMISHPSGLVLNRTEGTARHSFQDIEVEYSFGPHHNRVVTGAAGGGGRLLLLGDSFTFGWLVPDGSTIADRLQAQFKSHELINVAVGGWGTADHLKYLELFCADLKPSLVYIFMNSYDIDRAVRSPLYRLDAKGEAVSNADVRSHPAKSLFNRIPGYGWLLEHSHLAQLARRSILATRAGPGPQVTVDGTALGRALWLKLKAVTDACGTQLRVFFIGWARADDAPENLTVPFVERALAEGFFDRHGIRFNTLRETAAMSDFLRERSRYEIPNDGHPNAAGAGLLYRALTEVIAGDP